MRPTASSLFSQEDFARVEAAVKSAESRTSGEIVPFVVAHSDPYEVAEWRAGAFAAVLAFVIAAVPEFIFGSWMPKETTEIAVATLVSGIAGMLAARYLDYVKRTFAGKHTIDRRVGQRAAEAFVSEEVFATRDRTGILLFVSILEHRVLVLRDSGINAKVESADWEEIVGRVLAGIKSGKPGAGMVDAILRCGELLEKHGVDRRSDDRDELPDGLRVSET